MTIGRYILYRLPVSVLLATVLLLATAVGASAAETPGQVMKRASALIERASGIEAGFTMTSGGKTLKGTLKSSAAGFVLSTPGYSSWYDGKNLWTYNASSRETTLTVPTGEELREANPMMMVSGYEGVFTPAFAKKQSAGTRTLVLVPKSRKTGLKNVVVVLDSKTYRPKRITVTPSSGTASSVTITSLKTDVKFPKSTFTYPKTKYPKVEIIDLR